MIGQTISHYKITSKLGEGGMGEVYRATDSKLNRDVALKVLPEAFAADQERMARFSREAQVLASLNHPNIATIYGLEDSDDKHALVLELVEGETLAERIQKGAIPLEESLKIALQVAEGLEAAHDSGIIHRDLKPANVKITPEGKVKVLDFGLAKALADEVPAADLTHSPTRTDQMTNVGVIMGTAGYMSPEQARGQVVDKRTDIWAFGCVLYEMLTGKQVFSGETATDILGAIVHKDPDWAALPERTPRTMHRLLRWCLERDSYERLRDIGDARITIKDCLAEPYEFHLPSPEIPKRPYSLAWTLVGLLSVALLAALVIPVLNRPSPQLVSHLSMSLAPSDGLDLRVGVHTRNVAISPDGEKVVFVGRDSLETSDPDGQESPIAGDAGTFRNRASLFLRRLQQPSATALAGTEGAFAPVFSPGGNWVAFRSSSQIKKIPIDGGPPVTLCELGQVLSTVLGTTSNFLSWGSDDTIVFDLATRGLWRVSANGGEPEPVSGGEAGIERMDFYFNGVHLPNQSALLLSLKSLSDSSDPSIEILDLETGRHRTLIPTGRMIGYAPTGHLVYSSQGRLMAVGFDPDKRTLTASPRAVVDDLAEASEREVNAALSDTGTLVYLPAQQIAVRSSTLFSLDERGESRDLQAPPLRYMDPRLSPDGDRIAFHVVTGGNEVWVRDLERGSQTRISFDPGEDETPIWSPNGEWLIWASSRRGEERSLRRKLADGTGQEEVLWSTPHHMHAGSVTPDGTRILVDLIHPETGFDIWVVQTEPKVEARPLLTAPYQELLARLSPDGGWLAYMSDQSGRNEIYVQPFPSLRVKIPISNEGGSEPVWSRDGGTLFYKHLQKVFAVDMRVTPDGLKPDRPRLLFEVPQAYSQGAGHFGYDVAADGRFIFTLESESTFPQNLRIILNFFEELKRLVPTGE